MRILTIADFFYPYVVGGSAIMAYELMREMVKRGHDVTVITRGEGEEEETVDGMKVYRYRFTPNPLQYPLSVLRAKRKVRELTQHKKFDIVNMHHASGGIAAEINKNKTHGAPTAFFFQGPWHGEAMAKERQGQQGERLLLKYEIRKRIDRYILRNCNAVFCLSDYMYGEATSIYPLLDSKFHKLSGGVDIGRFDLSADKTLLRRELDIPESAIVLITVRRLVARMGLENLVQAISLLGEARKDVVLLIGGKGELSGKLQELIDTLGLDNVRLLGYISDEQLPQYYQASDLFVLSSQTMEGYGLTTLEAFACGLPVLGTDTGATPEILGDVLPDFITQGVNPDSLAKDILRCLPKLDSVDKGELRRFAEDRSWARVSDRVERVFEMLVDEQKGIQVS